MDLRARRGIPWYVLFLILESPFPPEWLTGICLFTLSCTCPMLSLMWPSDTHNLWLECQCPRPRCLDLIEEGMEKVSREPTSMTDIILPMQEQLK